MAVPPQLTAAERKALDFLADRNAIQRTRITAPSGKMTTVERDVSGGLDCLIQILEDTDQPVLQALADALKPDGRSRLHIRKRLRRGRGRPPKRTAEVAFEVHSSAPRLKLAREHLNRKRPVPAVGMKAKPVTTGEAIAYAKKGRSTTYANIKALHKFARKHKKTKKKKIP